MRKFMIPAVILIAVMTVLLSHTASDPADYTGRWYSADGQCVYLFQEGIINCQRHSVDLADGSSISGAYAFSGDSVTLFAIGVEGLETIKKLYLIEHGEEIFLCENEAGTGKIYFIRSMEQK